MKTIHIFYLTVLLTISVACKALDNTNEKNNSSLGFTVSTSGELLLNGRPFQGIGVNYFNAFIRTLDDEGNIDDKSYEKGFIYLKEREIPFIRFALNGYWPKNWDLYLTNKDKYFKNLDTFIALAEKHGIGLIPSFFWHTPTVPDLVGESVNQWGNTKSKTHKLMNEYVSEVVMRYKDSPAIYGWEQGNEVNLLVDLPGDNDHLPPVVPSLGTASTRSKNDKLSSKDLEVMMVEFANVVRKYDSSRIVITGNAIPRSCAWNLDNTKEWKRDTKEQFKEVLNKQNPNPMSVISIHAYPASVDEGYFESNNTVYDNLIKVSMEVAFKSKKPLFLGEWGSQELLLKEKTKDKFMEILASIEKHKVPISAMWVFDYPPHDTEEGINVSPNNGPREYMLKEIMKVNKRISIDK